MNNDIITLRNETGAGVMDCKNALDKANGDLEKAKEILFKNGIAKAQKKSDRKTGAGLLEAYIHNNRIGVLLEVRCETDFVAKNNKFKEFAHDLSMQIASMNPGSVEELLEQQYIKDESKKVSDILKQIIAIIPNYKDLKYIN